MANRDSMGADNKQSPAVPEKLQTKASPFLQAWACAGDRDSVHWHSPGADGVMTSGRIYFARELTRPLRRSVVRNDSMGILFGSMTQHLIEVVRVKGFNVLHREDWPFLMAGIICDDRSVIGREVLCPDIHAYFDKAFCSQGRRDPEAGKLKHWEKWFMAFEMVRTGDTSLSAHEFSGLAISPLGRILLQQGFFPLTISSPLFCSSDRPIGMLNFGEQGVYFAIAISPTQAIVSLPKAHALSNFSQLPPGTLAAFVNCLTVARGEYVFSLCNSAPEVKQEKIGWQTRLDAMTDVAQFADAIRKAFGL